MKRTFDVLSTTYQGDDTKTAQNFRELAKKEFGSVSRALKVLIQAYLEKKLTD